MYVTDLHSKAKACEFQDLLIPNVLQGLSYLLVFMTALEFISAQAPLWMKGLLIGTWYALLATNHTFVEVPELFMIDNLSWVIFHALKTFLIFISIIMYLCVSKRYRYRQWDEVVNEQFLVEEIYERELDRAEQYERDDDDDDDERSLLIQSVEVPQEYGALNRAV